MNFGIWLQTATQGLPHNQIEAIRAELTGHYLDAVDDYLLQGLSSENAHHLALRELGDARAVCDGLRSVHIDKREYIRAMCIACMPTTCVLLFLPAISQIRSYHATFLGWIYAIFITLTAMTTLWANVNSLRMVSMVAYLDDEIDLPINLIRWGLYILFPITVFSNWTNEWVFMALINAPTFIYSNFIDINQPFVIIISILASFGLMLTGVGWVMLTFKMTYLPSIILPLLRGTMLVMGMGISLLAVGAVMRDNRLTSISTAISLVFGILTFAMFIILFYQLGRKSTPSRPSYA